MASKNKDKVRANAKSTNIHHPTKSRKGTVPAPAPETPTAAATDAVAPDHTAFAHDGR